ncbi:biotin transporter BioY [Candidatus Uabimicrobium sp. HlEnr_7]|uniref:biotin transporter BioY n=1 Tax=Candidatus Uabimicrobium helgolandensis TaxID=3095367 RepID=UPI00355782FA
MLHSCLFFTCLIIIGSQVSIDVPLSPVPIVLANFFTLLAGLTLGKKWGSLSVGLYLLCGATGLPVFAKGTGGLQTLFGPTGGYLFAYLVSTFFVGMISERGKHRWQRDLFALTTGVFILFFIGLPWLKISSELSWENTIKFGFTPYLLGAVIKVLFAFFIAQLWFYRSKLKQKNLPTDQSK